MDFEQVYRKVNGSDFKYNIGMTFICVDDIENPEYKIIDRYKVGDRTTYQIKQIDQYYDIIDVNECELDRDNIVIMDKGD